ncbi:MAG: sugar ABC transporter permease [Chloroflexota bacterium]
MQNSNSILNRLYPYLLIAPALLFVTVISLYPTIYTFYLSAHRFRRGTLEYVGLRNFRVIWDSGSFWNAIQLTAVFGIWFLLLVMVVGLLLALVFNRNLSGNGFYMTLIFIPWMISEIVAGIIWRWMFLPNIGVLQNFLGPIIGTTADPFSFLASDAGAMGIVVAATFWRALAFATLLLLAGLQTIPGELGEAAAIDGATRWQAFWRVTWPLLLPTTQVTVVFMSIQAVNAVGMFLAITQGGPGRATEVLSLQMYKEALEFNNWGYAGALAVVMFLINAVLAFIYIQGLRSQNAFD